MNTESIQNHLQSLSKNNTHITDIQHQKDLVYIATYSPKETFSPYSKETFQLQFIFSPQYPKNPPSVRFLQPIYHLNVDKGSGDVKMQIFQEWSQFLTITAVVECLDALLETPNPKYFISKSMLELFQNDNEKYFEEVENSLKKGQENLQMKENTEFIKEEEKREEIMLPNKKEEEQKKGKVKEGERIYIGKTGSEINKKQEQFQSKKISLPNHFGKDTSPISHQYNHTSLSQEYLSMKNTISKINDMIVLSINDMTEMERAMKRNVSPQLYSILKESHDKSFKDFQKLQQLEQQLRSKMMNTIEDEMRIYRM